MLDLKLLQRNPEAVIHALARRGSDIDVGRFSALDEQRRTLLGEVETLKGERNRVSAEVAAKKRGGENAQKEGPCMPEGVAGAGGGGVVSSRHSPVWSDGMALMVRLLLGWSFGVALERRGKFF